MRISAALVIVVACANVAVTARADEPSAAATQKRIEELVQHDLEEELAATLRQLLHAKVVDDQEVRLDFGERPRRIRRTNILREC